MFMLVVCMFFLMVMGWVCVVLSVRRVVVRV